MNNEKDSENPDFKDIIATPAPFPPLRIIQRGSLALLIFFRITRSMAAGMIIVALP